MVRTMPELMQRNSFLYKIKSLKDTILFSKHSGNCCYLLMSLLTNIYYYSSFFSKKPPVLQRDRTQITKKNKKQKTKKKKKKTLECLKNEIQSFKLAVSHD